MAGRPGPSKREQGLEPNAERTLQAEHRVARRAFRDLLAQPDPSMAEQQSRALAEQEMWSCYAMLLAEQGDATGATKALAASNSCGKLAIGLSKSTLADRVLALEAAVERARSGGADVRGAARRRKR